MFSLHNTIFPLKNEKFLCFKQWNALDIFQSFGIFLFSATLSIGPLIKLLSFQYTLCLMMNTMQISGFAYLYYHRF